LNPAFSADIARLLELAESLERRLSSLQEMHDELSRRIQSLQAQPSAKSARTGAGGEA
jgi:cell division septum initiation protein DivIVA